MNNYYKIRELKIEELYVNPDNARFINVNELPDEISAIKELTKMNTAHICKLAKDIAKNGLNPNELPIVVPGPELDGRFLVIDGNRRITSIKLMTQYKKDLDEIGINSGQKRALSALNCDIKTIVCVVYEDENNVNALIEKIHTSNPGIGRVNWDPQAQDRHQFKCGTLSRRLALIEMLRSSKYTNEEAKRILRKHGWVSKLLRYVRNDDYMLFFGISFDEDNNIYLFYEESEVIKSLSQLLIDLNDNVASKIAQTEDVREAYINSFPLDKRPSIEKLCNPLMLFNVETKQFEMTELENNIIGRSINKDTHGNVNPSTNEGKSVAAGASGIATTINKSLGRDSTDTGTGTSGNGDQSGRTPNTNNDSADSYSNGNSGSDYKTTLERSTLIPKDENIPIKNQRTLDLYNELKLINVGRYTNVVSIAFRSLVEFSINNFLESKKSKLANNEQVSFFEKLEKVIRILESIYSKQELEDILHAIYRSMDTFNSMGKKCDLNSIPHLHVLIHSHNYHPLDKELKVLYNNYSPLLRLIWENI